MRRLLAAISGRRGPVPAALSLALLLGAPGPAGAVPSNAPDPGAYTTNGPVHAIARANGRTYIGGDFTRVGTRSGSGVVLSPQGAPQSFPEVAGGDVNATISDGEKGWFIGGSFTAVGGQRHLGLAHVKSDGSVDSTFNPVVTDFEGDPATVNALELSRLTAGARTLYVGGEFSRIGLGEGQIHENIAALNASDGRALKELTISTDCTDSKKPGCSAAVHALRLTYIPLPVTVDGVLNPNSDQPVLFVGGGFSEIGPSDLPTTVNGLAAVWGIGSVDATNSSNAGQVMSATPSGSWVPAGTGVPAAVYTLQVGPLSNPTSATPALPVYVGGWLKPTTDTVKPMVRAYQFKISNKTNRTVSAAVEFNTSAWTPNPTVCTDDCAVPALALDDSTSTRCALGPCLYFGGDFTKAGKTNGTAAHLGKIRQIGNPEVTTAVAANTAAGAQLGAGVDASVRALVRSASTLIAGGDFSQRVLALDSSSGAPSPTWATPSPDSSVRALAADSSTSSIYAGGDFRALGAVPRIGLAAFDSSGALDLNWAPGVTDPAAPPHVHALAASASTLYVGGQFTAVTGPAGSQAHANLAAIDAASGNPVQAFDPKPSLTPKPPLVEDRADVLSLSLLGSTLYVGGAFDQVGVEVRENLAAVDAATGAVSGWDPRVEGRAEGLEPVVHAILPACGAVYVGGRFDEVGGQPHSNLAALDPASGVATPWDPRVDGTVLALARSGPTIYAGGTFTAAGGASRQKVAGLNVAGGSATAFNAGISGRTVGASVRALAVSDSAVYIGGIFANAQDRLRSNLAAADPATGAPTDWNPSADGRVDALALGDGALYVGGGFGSLGVTGQRGFASFGSGAGSPFTSASCALLSTSSETRSDSPAPEAAAAPGEASSTTPPDPSTSGVGRLTVSPDRVSLRGAPLTLRFSLSRSMSVRLRFERRSRGRCRARGAGRRGTRPCLRYIRFTVLTRPGRRGLNRLSFPRQRVGRRRLVPGRYRVTLVPLEAGRAAVKRIAYFRVVAR